MRPPVASATSCSMLPPVNRLADAPSSDEVFVATGEAFPAIIGGALLGLRASPWRSRNGLAGCAFGYNPLRSRAGALTRRTSQNITQQSREDRMIWQQVYNPLHNAVLSTLLAAVPIVVLLGTL